MIVAAFAGTGKTFFCNHHTDAIDLECMPFKYTNYYDIAGDLSGLEDLKANEDLILRPGWQKVYFDVLMDLYKQYPHKIIVIPTVFSVLQMLGKAKVPYTLVIPDRSLKEEYEQRYLHRGNTEDFLDIFIGNWDLWMDELQRHKNKQRIILKSGEYLSDVIGYEVSNR